jgi:hypothetical protein
MGRGPGISKKNKKLQATSYKLQATSYKLQASSLTAGIRYCRMNLERNNYDL